MKTTTLLLLLAGASLVSAGQPVDIVKDGVPNAQIVIAAENRPRMVTLAALELQRGIEKLSGARLPIVTSSDPSLPVKIYVGKSPEADKLGVKSDDLKHGAYRMVSGDGWILLTGNDTDFDASKYPISMGRKDPGAQEKWDMAVKESGLTDSAWGFPFRGLLDKFWNPKDFAKIIDDKYGPDSFLLWTSGGNTLKGFWNFDEGGSLNAVHALLRSLGVRWFMPGDLGEILPKTPTLTAGPFNETVKPDYAVRAYMWGNYSAFGFEDVLWALRLGMNSGYQYMGPIGYHGLVNVHRAEAMQMAHPEYYALLNGKRDTEHRGWGTPCFTSEGLIKETVNYCRFMIDKFDMPMIDIWPGDGLQRCGCDGCKGKSMSDLVWGFADRVAREVYKTHPHKRISCGAYTSYKLAPDSIDKFSPNLSVWMVNLERANMMQEALWKEYWESVMKWQSKTSPGSVLRAENNRYHIWGITEDEEGAKLRGVPISYPAIHPRATARDLKALKGISSADTGEQSQLTGKWKAMGLEHITLYVRARFLWDASLDVDEVLDEYCSLFYGPAAKQMKEAINFTEANLAEKDLSRRRGRGNPMRVPFDTALKLRELLDRAKIAAGDTVYGQRVQAVISDLQPKDEYIANYQKESEVDQALQKAPLAAGVTGADTSKAVPNRLENNSGGKATGPETTFTVGWDKDVLILDIICSEPEMNTLRASADILSGDYVTVLLKTQGHSYYHIAINPDGKILEGNPSKGWKSLAEVTTKKSADSWRVQLRIPVVGNAEAEADPNHRVEGAKPTAKSPWYFNVGRQRMASLAKPELQAFSPTGGDWHDLTKFGKLEIK